jgi:hypothetical protein
MLTYADVYGHQLAEQGNGTFAFIPDAVIVGTTFVNRYAQKLNH